MIGMGPGYASIEGKMYKRLGTREKRSNKVTKNERRKKLVKHRLNFCWNR